MKKLLISLGLILLMCACTNEHGKKKGVVYEYMVSDVNNDMMYWYIIYMSDGNAYNYRSTTPVGSFSGVQWSKGEVKEIENMTPDKEIEVTPEELNDEMQTELNETIETTDMEGNNTDSESDSNSDAGADGDAGGGDAGADGGGGGD